MESIETLLNSAKEAATHKYQAARAIPLTVQALADLDREITVRENQIMGEVCGETTDEGKAKYTNEAARKAAHIERCMTDSTLNDLQVRRARQHMALKEAEADLAYQHDLHRAYVAAMHAIRQD